MPHHAADAILSAVSEALLAPEAVEAVAPSFREHCHREGHVYHDWDTASEPKRDESRDGARFVITAALTAAGIGEGAGRG